MMEGYCRLYSLWLLTSSNLRLLYVLTMGLGGPAL